MKPFLCKIGFHNKANSLKFDRGTDVIIGYQCSRCKHKHGKGHILSRGAYEALMVKLRKRWIEENNPPIHVARGNKPIPTSLNPPGKVIPLSKFPTPPYMEPKREE